MVGPKVRYSRGELVYSQGDRPVGLYQAATGLVRLSRTTARGRTYTVRHVLPGDYFGEDVLGAPAAGGRTHTAEVLTSAQVMQLDPATLTETGLVELARNLGDQLRRAMTFEVHLQSGALRQRVVRYLLELADTPLGAEDADNRLYVRATHELLAEGSGSTRESVSKIITELREEELVESGYRHITLLDLQKLQAIAVQTAEQQENA